MDRLAALFEQLTIPEIARLMRRAVYSSVVIGVIAFAVGAITSHAFAGLGICIGLAIGLVNIRLVTRSISHVSELELEKPKRVIASRAIVRLIATTAVVIGLVILSTELGIATAGGIALFYLVLVANLVRALLGGMHQPGVTA